MGMCEKIVFFFYLFHFWVWLSQIRVTQFNRRTCWIRNQKKKKQRGKKNRETKKQKIQNKKHMLNKFPMSGITIVTDRVRKKKEQMETVITYHRHRRFLKLNLHHRWENFNVLVEAKVENFGSNKRQQGLGFLFFWWIDDGVCGGVFCKVMRKENERDEGERESLFLFLRVNEWNGMNDFGFLSFSFLLYLYFLIFLFKNI